MDSGVIIESSQGRQEDEQTLQAFRAEIALIYEEEKWFAETGKNNGTNNLASYKNFSVDELELSDMLMWQKVKDGSVTREEFGYYQKLVIGYFAPDFDGEEAKREVLLKPNENPSSREAFLRLLRSKATPVFLKRELQEIQVNDAVANRKSEEGKDQLDQFKPKSFS